MDSRIDGDIKFDSDGLPIPSAKVHFDSDGFPIPQKKNSGPASPQPAGASSSVSSPTASGSKGRTSPNLVVQKRVQKPLPLDLQKPQAQPTQQPQEAPSIENNFGLDYNKIAAGQQNTSESTANVAPQQVAEKVDFDVNHAARVKEKQDYTNKAIDNATVKALKIKGIVAQPGSVQYNQQRNQFVKQVQNGDASVATKDGEAGLKRTTGFLENIKNGWNEATTGAKEADDFTNNMTTEERVAYLNKKQTEEKPSPYVGERPSLMGSAGHFAGSSVPFLGKAAVGAAIGAGAVAAAPETLGSSLAGLPVAMSFMLTAEDMANQGVQQEVSRRYDILKQQHPERSDVENMKEAENGALVGGVGGILENALLMGTGMKTPIMAESKSVIGQTVHNIANSAVHLGAVSSGVTAAEQEVGNLQGVKTSQSDILKNAAEAFKEGATTGAALTAIMHVPQMPKILKSAYKYALKDENPQVIRGTLQANENAGNIPEGTTQKVMTDLNGYKQALGKMPDGLSPESQASIAGLIQKKENLVKESKTKDDSFKDFYKQKIDEIDGQIANIQRTGKPFEYEIDEATGKPYQQPTYDDVAQSKVEDLAVKISKGKKITEPEDLQLQQNFPKELEAQLQKIKDEENKGKAPVKEQKTENPVPEQTSPKISELTGYDVMLNGERGQLRTDEENNVVFSKDGKETILGKTTDEKFNNSNAADHGISEVPKVEVKGNNVKIDNEPFELVSFNHDNDGNLASVSLKREDGKVITKRDKDLALDIAVAKNNHDFESKPEPADYTEHKQVVDANFNRTHGQKANEVIDSMPDEVADTFAAMDNKVQALAPEELQQMTIRASEWVDDARKKISESASSDKEKRDQTKILDRFEKDLNKYYGKLEKQRNNQAAADVKRGQAENLAAAKQRAKAEREKTKQLDLELKERTDIENLTSAGKANRKRLYDAVGEVERGELGEDANARALHYFADGGKVDNGELAGNVVKSGTSLENRGKEKVIATEAKDNNLVKPGAPTIKEVAHELWSEANQHHETSLTTQDFENAVNDVLSGHTSRESAAQDFVESYHPEFAMAKQEREWREQFEAEHKAEIEAEEKWLQDKANEEAEIQESPEYIQHLIDQYETETNTPDVARNEPGSKKESAAPVVDKQGNAAEGSDLRRPAEDKPEAGSSKPEGDKGKQQIEGWHKTQEQYLSEISEAIKRPKPLVINGKETTYEEAYKNKRISKEQYDKRFGGLTEKQHEQMMLSAGKSNYTFQVKEALKEGKYQKAISEDQMTPSEAKKIIESAHLEVPKDILKQPKTEKPTISPSTEKPAPKVGDVFRKFADVVEKGKISKLEGFQVSTGFTAVWDSSLSVVAATLRTTGKVADAIQAGLQHIKESDWYKNLKDKEDFDKKYVDHLNKEYEKYKEEEGIPDHTGIKNAIVDAEREAEGKNPVLKKAFSQIKDAERTKAKIESGEISEEHIRDLTQAIASDAKFETDLTPDEVQHVLMYDRLTLSEKGRDIEQQLTKAREEGDDANVARLLLKQEQNDALKEANDVAASRTGTSWSAVGRARQLIIKNDYTFEALKRKAKAANGKELTPAETERFRELSKQIEEKDAALLKVEEAQAAANKEIEELKALNEAAKKAQADKAVQVESFDGLKDEVKKQVKAQGRRTIERIKHDRENIKANLKAKWKNHIQGGSAGMNNIIPLDMVPDLVKLAKSYIEEGLAVGKEAVLDKIIDRVHKDVVEAIGDVDKTTVRDAITGYGKVKQPNADPVEKAFRDIAAQGRLVSSIELAQKGELPLKTGQQRDKPSAEQRRLQKELNKEIKDNNIQVVSPEQQLKTSLDAAKTRLKNQIEDLTDAIAKKEQIKKDRKGIEYDQEATGLKKQRDELRKEYDEVFGTDKELTVEDRLKRATKAVNKSIEKLEERIKNKDFSNGKPKVTSAALEALKEKRKGLRETYNDLMKAEGEWNRRKLGAMKKHIAKRTAYLNEIKNTGNLDKYVKERTRQKLPLDAEAMKAKAALQKVKNDVDNMMRQREFENMTAFQRGIHYANRLFKGVLISNPAVLVRILGSVVFRGTFKAPTAISAYGFSKLFPGLAKGAFTEAITSRKDLTDHLIEYYSTMFSKENFEGMKFAFKNHATMEDLALNKAYHNHPIPNIKVTNVKTAIQASFFNTLKVLDKNASLHGAGKATASLPEYKAYKQTIFRNLLREGVKPEELGQPELQEVANQLAFQKSLRAKFMQENNVSDLQKTVEEWFRRKKIPEVAEGINFLLPITKISSNYISEALTKMPLIGNLAAIRPIAKLLGKALGSDSKLTEKDKSVLLRTLAYQGVGVGTYVLGWYLHQHFNPMYKSSASKYAHQKKDEDEESGWMALFETLSHSPDALVFQAGVSHAWVWDKYDEENPGEKSMATFMGSIMPAIVENARNTASSSPYLSTSSTVIEPLVTGKGVGKAAANMLMSRTPGSTTAKEIAEGKYPVLNKIGIKSGNEEKVKPYEVGVYPKTFLDNVGVGIPGWRQEILKRLYDEKYHSAPVKKTHAEKVEEKRNHKKKEHDKIDFENQINQ